MCSAKPVFPLPCMEPLRDFCRSTKSMVTGFRDGSRMNPALVVIPAHGNVLGNSGKNVRIAYVSGWAALDNARSRSGAERLIPYSDHADFDELLTLVDRSAPKHIDVVHGYRDPFAKILHGRGNSAAAPHRTSERTNIEAEG